jgi:Trypsin-co-occurring domain 1
MPDEIVIYEVGNHTPVQFEIEPGAGYRPAGSGQVLGQVETAVAPAVDAAKAVLEKVKEAQPDGIELRFGIRVSGAANWVVAKASTEGSFEITLRWSRTPDERGMREE